MKIVTAAFVAVSFAACGGSSSNSGEDAGVGGGGGGGEGSAVVTGTVSGLTFNPLEAISTTIPSGMCSQPFSGLGGASVNAAVIWISNVSGTCNLNGASCSVQASQLTLALVPWTAASSGGAPTLGPGTFTVNPSPGPLTSSTSAGAFAQIFATDGSCNLTATSPRATSGSVTLTTVNSSNIAGTFSLTMSDGSNLSGSFSTVNCALNIAPFCSGSFACGGTLTCS